MPVTTKHEGYEVWAEDWRLSRAVCRGERAVKDEGIRELTLPKLSGHVGNAQAYETYVQHAHFFPGASRFREGFHGLLFMTGPQIEMPPALDAFRDDVTGSDMPCTAEEFVRTRVGRELVTTGRCGVLTDFPLRQGPGGGTPEEGALPRDLSVAEAERRGVLPTWTLYKAERIINWNFSKAGGRERLDLVVLEEWKRTTDPEDKFQRPRVKQWRVLELAPAPADLAPLLPEEARPTEDPETSGDGLAYHVEIWRVRADKREGQDDAYEVVANHWPRRDGRLMTEIQFDFLGTEESTATPAKPPLLDVVTINLGHFRNSAMYEHGLLFTGSPQPYITGYDKEEELGFTEREAPDEHVSGDYPTSRELHDPSGPSYEVDHWHLGASTILLIKAADALPGVLVVKAEDLSALQEAKSDKWEEMVVVGGRILAPDKLPAEAARTEEIRREGERSVVTTIGTVIGNTMTRALGRVLAWVAGEGDVLVKVDTEFLAMMDPATAEAVVRVFFQGGYAKSDMRDMLRRGRWIRPERTDADIDAELLADPPAASGLGGGEPPPVPGEDQEDQEPPDEGDEG